jgi:hypothetical protein
MSASTRAEDPATLPVRYIRPLCMQIIPTCRLGSKAATEYCKYFVCCRSLDSHQLKRYVSLSPLKHCQRSPCRRQGLCRCNWPSLTTGRPVVEAWCTCTRLIAVSDTGIESQSFIFKPACRCAVSSTVKLTIAMFSLIGPRRREDTGSHNCQRFIRAAELGSKMSKRPQNSLSPIKSPKRPPPPPDALSLHASIFSFSSRFRAPTGYSSVLFRWAHRHKLHLYRNGNDLRAAQGETNVSSRFNVSLYTVAASFKDNQSLLSLIHCSFYL